MDLLDLDLLDLDLLDLDLLDLDLLDLDLLDLNLLDLLDSLWDPDWFYISQFGAPENRPRPHRRW